MQAFDDLCPRAPDWAVPWDRIRERFDWIRAMEGVAQDPVHHAEGDVAVHTWMAAQALAASPEFRALPADRRTLLFATVLLHDVAKPFCTQTGPDGRVTAHGHSRGGELAARRILWELGAPIAWREHVAALVRHHQVPFWALERADLQSIALRVSLVAGNADLAMLARADITGRTCGDAATVLENIDLFAEYCTDLGVLDRPWPFASDHARFDYFRTPGRDPAYAAFDDTRLTVTVLSGLPGVGKDTWIAAHRPGLPVVSLDATRERLRIKPTDDQGPVAAAAREEARVLLRAGRDFVWNATNISRQQRERCISLIAGYHGRVEIVALEAPPDVVRARNRQRERAVPDAALDRLIRRWESPDLTEAHTVHRITA
ncbi:putative kinase [Allocatelliglobosispora scoriae]|uniref:Putative kinase n=1 Tax=Allocatelliglobosispora scoriae TaxID=643052 RepID=A0A841BHD4_9ACTN|nr:AAA family ATPase [Allocatelliglobosispora scoriae]MBB5867045.1 putative kinase [Allocatelliglobosispora scoriae]